MCDRRHRGSRTPLPGCTASTRRQTDAVEPRMQDEEQGQEREEDGVGVCAAYRNVSANF